MIVFPQLPEGYVGVVHESHIIIAKTGEGHGDSVQEEWHSVPYLRIQLIDPLDRRLDIPRMYGSSNFNSLLNRFQIRPKLDVGLDREFIRGCRVAIGDEVVHYQVIDITEAWH